MSPNSAADQPTLMLICISRLKKKIKIEIESMISAAPCYLNKVSYLLKIICCDNEWLFCRVTSTQQRVLLNVFYHIKPISPVVNTLVTSPIAADSITLPLLFSSVTLWPDRLTGWPVGETRSITFKRNTQIRNTHQLNHLHTQHVSCNVTKKRAKQILPFFSS